VESVIPRPFDEDAALTRIEVLALDGSESGWLGEGRDIAGDESITECVGKCSAQCRTVMPTALSTGPIRSRKPLADISNRQSRQSKIPQRGTHVDADNRLMLSPRGWSELRSDITQPPVEELPKGQAVSAGRRSGVAQPEQLGEVRP
jgi:hypothetical protein